MCMYTSVHMCHGVHVVQRTALGSWFSPSTMWVQGSQAWQQVPLPTEPSCQSFFVVYMYLVLLLLGDTWLESQTHVFAITEYLVIQPLPTYRSSSVSVHWVHCPSAWGYLHVVFLFSPDDHWADRYLIMVVEQAMLWNPKRLPSCWYS